jgi:16S rRNA (adenine1518-N6/adenine1519-N6)-dimethyltransferase
VKRPAKKRFGQHFLEPAWTAKLIQQIAPKPDDIFVEIGPGRGALTRPLAEHSRSVLAFEIDRQLAADLRATCPANVTIVEGDFLQQPFGSPWHLGSARLDSQTARLRMAANLPYNVASPILFRMIKLFDDGIPFTDATVMLQREVADRLLAEPGSKQYGVLTVLVRHSASVTRLLDLPPGAFRPAPKVRSTVVRLNFHSPTPPVRDRAVLTELVQAVFTRRRKTFVNALRAYEPARNSPLPSWLDPRRRPETLSIEEFARLADDLAI